ncbi:MAG: beta-lactamase family protein [Proteobacteria bacterium]|nr:beta-lactamase family protein [Pseudomonadota bacterium]
MFKCLKSVLLATLFILTHYQPTFATPSSSLPQEKIEHLATGLDRFVAAFLKKVKSPGCVIAVVGPQQTYFLKAYGVKQLGKSIPITQKTIFQLGSASKPISATLALLLQSQDKLSIESSVTDYLAGFKLNGQTNPLLVKHLLSHTSGLPRYGFNALIEASATRETLYQKVQNIPVTAQPGESFDYHNVMFSLIEDVMEASTNQSFETLMKNNLFEPLKMKRASIGYQNLKEATDRAIPHTKNEKGKCIAEKNYSKTYYTVSSAGGINASMEDLIPFLQLHLGRYPEILSPEARKILHTSQITEDEPPSWLKKFKQIEKTGYSLGWRWMDYAGERVVYHGGWLKGFHAMIAFLPEHNIGLIVLDNAETKLTIMTLMEFLDLYLSITPSAQGTQN